MMLQTSLTLIIICKSTESYLNSFFFFYFFSVEELKGGARSEKIVVVREVSTGFSSGD